MESFIEAIFDLKTNPLSRYAYLDALKAIAIIAVVLYHSGFLRYGYLGVDVFLVIAGFLTTRSLVNDRKEYFPFVIGRIVRLLPVLLVAGLAAMTVGWFAMLPDDYENLSESVIATNVFGNNILSAITTGDYWDVVNDYKPLMHTWYVGLLMQIYLVYPLLFYAARLDRSSPRKTLLILISSLAVLSLLGYFGSTNEAHRFYYLPARFFEFAVGGIVALAYEPEEGRVVHPAFTFLCYALLMALLVLGYDLIPPIVRLPLVVALCAVLIVSGEALDNKLTANQVLAKIGVASYNIFVWHQVLLAFYRYLVGNQFALWTYLLYLGAVGVVSWCSYRLIEQSVSNAMASKKGTRVVYTATLFLWLVLTGFAGYVYLNAGVVRDVPELYISVEDRHRHMHAEYNEGAYQYNRPFVSEDKAHWLVIGDSFGRDFVNTVLESCIADKVEVSYMGDFMPGENRELFASADRVFVSMRSLNRRLVSAVEVECWSAGMSPDRVIVVGEKNFGENNGHVYARRYRPDYYEQRVSPEGGDAFLSRNRRFRDFYGERYLDLMSFVTDDAGRVRVFTPDHHFISADCRHLSLGGAKFFAERIEWGRYLPMQ